MFITILAGSINAVAWTDTGSYQSLASIYPVFSFSRCIYNLTNTCAKGLCYKSFKDVDSETMSCIYWLYVMGILYGILGTYLNEVI